MMGAFGEYGRDLIIERTTDGLASAHARGKVDRPKGLSPAAQQKASIASSLYKEDYQYRESVVRLELVNRRFKSI